MTGGRRVLEITLAILKPDLVARARDLQLVEQRILNEGFYIVRSKLMQLSRSDTELFYAEHHGKFFFNRLVTYMSSGPIKPLILVHIDAINKWRQLMGPTKTYLAKSAAPNSIRGQFGLTDTRNSVHGSDSKETALKEVKFFFPDFDPAQWMKKEQLLFQQGNVYYDSHLGIHLLKL